MYGTVVSNNPALIVNYPDKYKNELFTALYADKNIYYFIEGSGDTVFDCKGMAILNLDLNNIILDDKFDEDDPDTFILMKLLAWHIKFRK